MKKILFALLAFTFILPELSFAQGDNRNATFVHWGQVAVNKKDSIPPAASLGFSVGPTTPDSMGSRLGIIVDTNAVKIRTALLGTSVAKGFIAFDNSLGTYVYYDGTAFIPLWGFGRTSTGGIIVPLVRNSTSANNSLITLSDAGTVISNNSGTGTTLKVSHQSASGDPPFEIYVNDRKTMRSTVSGILQNRGNIITNDTSNSPTWSITIPSAANGGSGAGQHNLSTMTGDTEFWRVYWNSNRVVFSSNATGTGTVRPIDFSIGGSVKLTIDAGGATASQYRLSALNTAPSSATDTGTTGEIRITSGFIYICTATNTWVRTALSTW